MNIGLDFRRGLESLPGVLESVVARINTIWKREHTTAGGHGNITASSLVVNGPARTGALRVEGLLNTLPSVPPNTTRRMVDIGDRGGDPDVYLGLNLHARQAGSTPSTGSGDTITTLRIDARSIFIPFSGSSATIFNLATGAVGTFNREVSSQLAVSVRGRQVIDGRLDLSPSGGGQITFPATQNPSADPNTLDDYREGAWTPTWTFGGGSTGITYSTNAGSYIKVGRYGYLSFRTIFTSKGSSVGQAVVNGVPFAMTDMQGCSPLYGAMTGLGGGILFFGATPVIAATSPFATGIGVLTDGNFTNTTDILGFVTGTFAS